MFRILIYMLVLVGQPVVAQPTSFGAAVDQIFERAVRARIPGAAVGVLDGGKVLYKKGYGWADVAAKRPMTTDALFDLASCSKQFTATAILILAQRGKLSLTDDARKYLPELKEHNPKRPIRIADMLHMVSGLPSYEDLLDNWEGKTNIDALKALSPRALNFPTGSKYRYSNTEYCLLATVVSRASGQTFGNFLSKEIFQPCGMKDSFVLEQPVSNPKRVTGYRKAGKGWKLDRDDYPGIVGDGSIFSSVDDLILFDQAMRAGKLLNPEMYKMAVTSGKLDNGKATDYGFGWNVESEDHGHALAWHSGAWNGTATCFGRFIDSGVSIIVLINCTDAQASDFADKVADIVFPQYSVGERVVVKWRGDYYPAKILRTKYGSYLVHYDTYSSKWDGWVTAHRVKPLGR